ncbi:MAG: zinc ribbon domain-containing protein [bacterium]
MPLYEFTCQQCGRLCEFLVRSSTEKVELRCPACGCERLQRVLSRVNSVVAGSGGGADSSVEHRSCPSGTCSTITLPGHSR